MYLTRPDDEDTLQYEAAQARRIASRAHNAGLIKTLEEYAEELDRRLAAIKAQRDSS